MKDYREALLYWFAHHAGVPNIYGGTTAGSETLMKHLKECGFSGDTPEPKISTVSQFAGTFVSNENVEAIVLRHWSCTCGKYERGEDVEYERDKRYFGSKGRETVYELAVVGRVNLGEVIKGVIEAGEEGESGD